MFWALNFVDSVNFSAFKKGNNSLRPKFRASNCVKMADFALLESKKFKYFPENLSDKKITKTNCNMYQSQKIVTLKNSREKSKDIQELG